MFLHIMRVSAIFADAQQMIRPEYFDRTTEPHYAVLWGALVEAHARYGTLNYECVSNFVLNRLTASPDTVSPGMRTALLQPDRNGIIYNGLHSADTDLVPELGRDILRKFLRERGVIQPLRTLFNQGGGRTFISDMPELLNSAVSELGRIESLRTMPIAKSMPARGSEFPPPIIYEPTGLQFIDLFTRGQRRGDANGLLGVYGGGKTTLGLQIAVESARLAAAEGNQELSVYLSYEESESKVLPRIWANAGSIRKAKLESVFVEENWDLLSTLTNLEPYERELTGSAPGMVLSESERWDQARTLLDGHFVLFDMSGSENYPGAGAGYVDEIVGLLERLVRDRNASLRTVIVDYAGLVCRRHMEANDIAEERLRYFLGGLGDTLRRQVANRFNCTVWLLQQLNAEQPTKSPTTLLHHTNAAEARNFAENLAVCGCLGTIDRSTGCLMLNWSKVRYHSERTRPAPILQIDQHFCRFVDVSTEYTADPQCHTFLDASDARTIYGGIDGDVPPRNPPRDIGNLPDVEI